MCRVVIVLIYRLFRGLTDRVKDFDASDYLIFVIQPNKKISRNLRPIVAKTKDKNPFRTQIGDASTLVQGCLLLKGLVIVSRMQSK